MKIPISNFQHAGKTQYFVWLLTLLLFTSFQTNSFSQVAFPSAEGFGKNATGGRGGAVYIVTNLNDNGSGSLRTALEASGARTIVFEVGGTIELNNNIYVQSGNLTIAGQTAPGDGITLHGAGIIFDHISNVIVRYMRFRKGDGESNRDSLIILAKNQSNFTAKDIIFDHCSFSWGTDENVDLSGSYGNNSFVKDVTFQRCLFSEDFGNGNILMMNNVNDITFTKNLLANCGYRNIRSSTCTNMSFEMVDNVIYGGISRTQIEAEIRADMIGNVYQSYPGDNVSGSTFENTSGANCSSPDISISDIYDGGNQENGSNWTIRSTLQPYVSTTTRVLSGGTASLLSSGSSFDQIKTNILNDVGANKSIDALDQEMINDVINGTGNRPNNESQTSGLPNLQGGSAPTDTDDDGMPDYWETERGLDINNPDDRNDLQSDGYTNLEHYINSMAGPSGDPVDVTGVSVSPQTATINIPDTVTLSRSIEPANATNQGGAWSSNNSAIATVDNNGVVSPVSVGQAVITYTTSDGGFTDSATITVTNDAINVTSVSVSPQTLTINIFGTDTLTATISPSDATDQTGTWSSSNTAIASIDQNGVITPVAVGTVTMTFTSNDGGFSDSAEVTINDDQYGTYRMYNADTDVLIQEVTGGETFNLDEIGDKINFRMIPQGGDGNSNVESVLTQWTGIEDGQWIESDPLYAGMTTHIGMDFEAYTVVEGTYNFTVTYFSGNGGTGNVVAADNFDVTFERGLTVDAGVDQTICEGDTATLTVTGDADNYVWSTGETTESITVSPNTTTTYTVTGSDLNGNSVSDDVIVTVNAVPVIDAGADEAICEGDSITLTAAGGGGTYQWSNGQSGASITVNPSTTTTYTVTHTQNGCSSSDDVTVTVNSNPIANAGNDVTIVNGGSTTLNATGGGAYVWSTGATTASITVNPSVTTAYTVTVTNSNGCTDDDEVVVNVVEHVIADAGEDVSICEGESTTLTASGGTSYEWSTGETTQSITVNPLNTTTYSVTVTNAVSSDSDEVTVTVNPIPIVDAGEDVTINSGESTTLIASGGNTYLWSNGETTASISVSPTQTTTYTVTTSINGCSDTDDVVVTVEGSSNVEADAGEDVEDLCQGESAILSATGGSIYEWSNGETTQTITVDPTETTTYGVTVSDGNSSDTDEVVVNVVDCALNTENQNADFEFVAFPNPTNGVLNVKVSGLDNDAFLYLRDMLGKQVQAIQVNSNFGQTTHTSLNLTSMSKGFYVLTLQGKDANLTKKIILR